MMRELLKSKIHRARVTGSDLNYMGSISICKDLMEKADLWSGEKVLVVNNNNGSRIWTYVIEGNNCEVCLNGAAAHLFNIGDIVIIMAFGFSNVAISPKNILVDKNNSFLRYFDYDFEKKFNKK